MENEPVTAIFFSCRRHEILKRTIDAFVAANTYPIQEMIIVNNSGDVNIHNILRQQYPNYTLVLHPENVGLFKSIDLGYAHIRTEYFFHSEDDWMCNGKGGFIEKSLVVMKARPDVEEVWLADMNDHPIADGLYQAGDVQYRLMAQNYLQGADGPNGWHGFTTAIALKRMSDYRKVAPYADIPWECTIWHREQAIGEEYHKLGYCSAILMDEYVVNIGHGQREYITGYEK